MVTPFKPLLAAVSILALTACSDSRIFSSWTQEAGSFLDEGQFGNPTMNNVQVQNGEKPFVIDLNRRFTQEVPTTINFDFNSARLDAQAMATLRQQANWIRQFPEVRFRVYGHTDLVGSDAYNKNLGQRRANAAVAYLSSQGIGRSRLEAVVSFGENRPLIVTQTPERQNRRTVTEVSGFVSGNQMVLDGKYAQVVYREYVDSATEAPPENATGVSAQ